MSGFFRRKTRSFQPLPIADDNSISPCNELVAEDQQSSEVRQDIGTPLDDEPEVEDSTVSGFNVALPQQDTSGIRQIEQSREIDARECDSDVQQIVGGDPAEEAWLGQASRPHSSTAATPTQDDNISPVDVSRIPVPNAGPQFLSFSSENTSVGHRRVQTDASDSIQSIPLPQIQDDGGEAEIAIVDAIANINAIPVNVDELPSDKESDIRDASDNEIVERDQFGRDITRRIKSSVDIDPDKVVTVEEVSDDDLPEVIEERNRDKCGEERDSDADSRYSMVSNNSLTGENGNLSDKDKRPTSDNNNKKDAEIPDRDEISSLSGLSSEDEAKGSDRLQVSHLVSNCLLI